MPDNIAVAVESTPPIIVNVENIPPVVVRDDRLALASYLQRMEDLRDEAFGYIDSYQIDGGHANSIYIATKTIDSGAA